MIRLIIWVIALICALPARVHAQAAPAPSPHANPHDAQRLQDRNAPAPDLPKGSIEATIHDAQGNPQAGIDVRLGILFQTIAEGESRESKTAKADAEGRVRFDGLKFGSAYSYRVTVKHGPAEYASTPFNLGAEAGQRVLIHVYPSTSDLGKASIVMSGLLVVQPRDDVFQFEGRFRVFNVGQVTWIPQNVRISLPKDFKAFRPGESMNDTKLDADGDRHAKISGTFTPGQHDLTFRFQTPKGGDEIASFDFSLPPHVREMRVITEASSGMQMEVDGFEPAQADIATNGTRVLWTMRTFERDSDKAGPFTIVLSGLPVPGLGRWIAVAIAVVLAGLGVASARGLFDTRIDTGSGLEEDLEHARALILDELVALERSRQAEAIGPRAYQRARQELLDALARLGAPARKKKSKRRPKRSAEATAGQTEDRRSGARPRAASGLSRSSGKP